jgi:hypothetical protein
MGPAPGPRYLHRGLFQLFRGPVSSRAHGGRICIAPRKGEGSGGHSLATLVSNPFSVLLFPLLHPSLCCRKNIRSMSQRRKGPARGLTSSTIPSLSLTLSPRARAVLLPLPPKHEIFLLLGGAPSEPMLVSVHLSVLPALPRPSLGRGLHWG